MCVCTLVPCYWGKDKTLTGYGIQWRMSATVGSGVNESLQNFICFSIYLPSYLSSHLSTVLSTCLQCIQYPSGYIHTCIDLRRCIQKFPDWPPRARTANGTALSLGAVLSLFVSHSSEFCSHITLCCFSTRVYYYCCLFRHRLNPETFGYTLVAPPVM
jgi:hypothetical protein